VKFYDAKLHRVDGDQFVAGAKTCFSVADAAAEKKGERLR